MIVELFVPCFIDQFRPSVGIASKKMLEHCGYIVHYNPNQTCCGQPALNAGYVKEAEDVATKFLNDFSNDKPVIMPSFSCCGMIRNQYDAFFKDGTKYHRQSQLKCNTYELSEFLCMNQKEKLLDKVLYEDIYLHQSCSCRNEISGDGFVKRILYSVKGLNVLNKSCRTECCGFGGTFSIKFPEISSDLAKQTCEEILATGAKIVVGSDYSCLMHLESYIKKNNIPLKTLHYSELFL